MSRPLEIAQEVIALEIAGLQALNDSLGPSFHAVSDILKATSGRIIVTGMGKSGHVARKIAATFSSTGAPALFVHPGEASHGDLGMISSVDTVLALSKSGETEELGNLLAYAARFSIPIVAITSRTDSTLAKAAKAAILLPNAQEACGQTRAPTTSTIMMMAVGDALAVSLLREKGFTASDFHGFHPAGNLGAALRRVSSLMHGAGNLPLCSEEALVTEAVGTLDASGFGCVGLTGTTGALTGILTDGDLRRLFDQDVSSLRAKDIMTKDPKTVSPDTLAGDALALLSSGKITVLFVVEGKKPVGLLHVHDCLTKGVF